MEKPIVSIILPNYNHAKFLEQRLQSILNQTYQNFEVILLDDASTDTSLDILERYKKHPKVTHSIFNTANSGSPFAQWKKGIALAKGEFIWIAESDDYSEPNFIETMINGFDENIGVGYCQSTDVDQTGKKLLDRVDYTSNFKPNIWEANFCISSAEFIEKYMLVKNVIPNASAVIFRRNLINKNTFDGQLINMKTCGDWLFWVRIIDNTKVTFVNEHLNYFRSHSQVTRNHSSNQKKRTRLLEEKMIREEVFANLTKRNKYAENTMYQKWYKMHNFKSVISKTFYVIVLSYSNNLVFGLNFLNLKGNIFFKRVYKRLKIL